MATTTERITVQEHESRRYRQIAKLELALNAKAQAVRDSKAHTKELEKDYDGILSEIHAAARDEGELPLLDMMDQLVTADSAKKTN
jgi:hypothetical protein